MKSLHFFCMTEKRNLFAFLAGKIDSLDLFSINDSDLSIDKEKDPNEKNFIETEIKEITNPDYRRFKKGPYLERQIIIFPRYRIGEDSITKENFLCDSTSICPWGKDSIVHMRKKRENFAMVKMSFLMPQGAVRITSEWEKILKGSTQTIFYNQNRKEKKVIGEKIIIEKLGPLSRTLNKAIVNSNYLERFFSPIDWRNLISEDVEVCEVNPMKPEDVEKNLYLNATSIRAKIQRIVNAGQSILTA